MQLPYISHRGANIRQLSFLCLPGPKLLYNRNLLYTAVTRAKKCLTIVGSEAVFQEMIQNKNEQARYTSLAERIQEF